MKLFTIILLCAIASALLSCGNDTTDDDYYWCEYHHTFHCFHEKCDKVKYCNDHNGYFEYPEHWVKQHHYYVSK